MAQAAIQCGFDPDEIFGRHVETRLRRQILDEQAGVSAPTLRITDGFRVGASMEELAQTPEEVFEYLRYVGDDILNLGKGGALDTILGDTPVDTWFLHGLEYWLLDRRIEKHELYGPGANAIHQRLMEAMVERTPIGGFWVVAAGEKRTLASLEERDDFRDVTPQEVGGYIYSADRDARELTIANVGSDVRVGGERFEMPVALGNLALDTNPALMVFMKTG